jgi:hypothetical protein
MEPVFHGAGVGYRRSILEDLQGAPDLAASCVDLLRGILSQEKDTDILATAIEAAPLSLLKEEEDRLIELAGLGAEPGMDTVEAVYRALARVGSDRGLEFLRGMGKDPTLFAPAGTEPALARLAVQSLAEVRDPGAPRLAAGLLFLRAIAYRERDILETWEGPTTDGRARFYRCCCSMTTTRRRPRCWRRWSAARATAACTGAATRSSARSAGISTGTIACPRSRPRFRTSRCAARRRGHRPTSGSDSCGPTGRSGTRLFSRSDRHRSPHRGSGLQWVGSADSRSS